MLFNSFIFLFFLVFVISCYYALPHKYRNPFLVLASYFFYGYWDWRFLSLIFISTAIDFYAGNRIHYYENIKKKKVFLYLSLISNLGMLGTFKYLGFFSESFISFINFFGLEANWTTINILLPVGISFYTFQTLSYSIDIYRGKLQPEKSFLNFALFVSFFPQLVAGPIERATNLLPQLRQKINFSIDQFREGIILITIGMFKKVLLGDTSGRIVDHVFAEPTLYSSMELLMGLILFTVQIYADFSGYSNIARGTAKLFGIDLMENFKQPYLSTSISEFWKTWHISLSSWLKDYIYIPLGGNRKGNKRSYINLMITMLLGGLWHGANWTFVIYGALHGIYLSVHKFMLRGRKPVYGFVYKGLNSLSKFIIKVLFTNFIVLFTRVFFRAPDFDTAFYFLDQMVNFSFGEYPLRVLKIILTYIIVTIGIDLVEYFTKSHAFLLKLKPSVRYAVVLGSWIMIFLYLYQMKPMPFVYFQF